MACRRGTSAGVATAFGTPPARLPFDSGLYQASLALTLGGISGAALQRASAPSARAFHFGPGSLTFEPVASGARVDATIDLSLRGPAMLFGGMFAGWYGKSWERGLAKLKAMMEEGEL
jgi:hypothetical protein